MDKKEKLIKILENELDVKIIKEKVIGFLSLEEKLKYNDFIKVGGSDFIIKTNSVMFLYNYDNASGNSDYLCLTDKGHYLLKTSYSMRVNRPFLHFTKIENSLSLEMWYRDYLRSNKGKGEK